MAQVKWMLLAAMLLAKGPAVLAQSSVVIGDTILPAASGAVLDIRAAQAGIRLPMLSTTARSAILKPSKGLLLFNLDSNYLEVNLGDTSAPQWHPVFYQPAERLQLKVPLLGGNQLAQPLRIGTRDAMPLLLITQDSARFYIDGQLPRIGLHTSSPRSSVDISSTDALILPSGTTEQRPVTPVPGMIRYNSSTGKLEGYTTKGWVALGHD